MKTAIVTDSTCYLSQEQVKEHHIRIIPIPVIIDGQVYREGIDITTEEFYEKLKTLNELPSTSQPSLGELVRLYEGLRDEGYDHVISIHLSSGISGFVNNIAAVTEDLEGVEVIPYDSYITCAPMANMVVQAAKMADANATPGEIIQMLDDLRISNGEYFIVDDLQNLVKGGRLSNSAAFIGNMLKIKPILTFKDKVIVAFEKVRSMKKAYSRIEKLFDKAVSDLEYPLQATVIHANNYDAAVEWRDKLSKKYPEITFDISYFGPVVGTHLGEKAMGLSWIKDLDKFK